MAPTPTDRCPTHDVGDRWDRRVLGSQTVSPRGRAWPSRVDILAAADCGPTASDADREWGQRDARHEPSETSVMSWGGRAAARCTNTSPNGHNRSAGVTRGRTMASQSVSNPYL